MYEIEKRVFKPDYNAGLIPNYEPPQIEEETKQLDEEETQLPNMPAEEQPFDPYSHDVPDKNN